MGWRTFLHSQSLSSSQFDPQWSLFIDISPSSLSSNWNGSLSSDQFSDQSIDLCHFIPSCSLSSSSHSICSSFAEQSNVVSNPSLSSVDDVSDQFVVDVLRHRGTSCGSDLSRRLSLVEKTEICIVSDFLHLHSCVDVDVFSIQSISIDSFSWPNLFFVYSSNGIEWTNLSSLSPIDSSDYSISAQLPRCATNYLFNQSFESESSPNLCSSIPSTTGKRTQRSSSRPNHLFNHSSGPIDSSLS